LSISFVFFILCRVLLKIPFGFFKLSILSIFIFFLLEPVLFYFTGKQTAFIFRNYNVSANGFNIKLYSIFLLLLGLICFYKKFRNIIFFNCINLLDIVNFWLLLGIGTISGARIEKYFGIQKNIILINRDLILNFLFAGFSFFFIKRIKENIPVLGIEKIFFILFSLFFSALINFSFFLCVLPAIGIQILLYLPPFFLNKNLFIFLFLKSLLILLCLIAGFSLVNEHIMLFPEPVIITILFSGIITGIISIYFKRYYKSELLFFENKILNQNILSFKASECFILVLAILTVLLKFPIKIGL